MYTVWGTEPEATARNTKDSITHSVVAQKEIETISELIDNELPPYSFATEKPFERGGIYRTEPIALERGVGGREEEREEGVLNIAPELQLHPSLRPWRIHNPRETPAHRKQTRGQTHACRTGLLSSRNHTKHLAEVLTRRHGNSGKTMKRGTGGGIKQNGEWEGVGETWSLL